MRLSRRELAKAVAFVGLVGSVTVSMIVAGAKEPGPSSPPKTSTASGRAERPVSPVVAAPARVRQISKGVSQTPAEPPRDSEGGGKPATQKVSSPSAPSAKPQAARLAAPPMPSRGPLPPFPAPSGAFPGQAAEPPSGPPPDKLWLSGVIQGEPKLALLRKGESRYLVKEGDPVAGTYRLTKISANSVTLQRGTRSLTLRVGQY